MAIGFPTRPSRDDLGPERRNFDGKPVANNETHLGADYLNLMAWQIAGSGLMVPRAWLLIDADGTLLAAAESWDPRGESAPTVTLTEVGEYTIAYASTYVDHTGVASPTGLIAGDAPPQVKGYRGQVVVNANGYEIIAYTQDAAGADANAKVLVKLW